MKKITIKTLKMTYGIDDSYSNLLLRSEYVSIHQRHLRFLGTEIFKSISQINPEFMWSFFKQKVILQFKKGTYSKRTKNSVHLLRLFIFEVLLYRTIFLLKLNPAIQFSNLKPKLKIWEILTVNV